MIKLDNVGKEFIPHQPAVAMVSFEVREGETLVLLGTSGSGKTTTLRMINRLIEPSRGKIYVGGQEIRSVTPEVLRRGIGYVLQDSGLFPHYTVAENIAVVPRLLKWDAKRIADRTAALLEKLHLPPDQYLDAYPSRLSGGQAQRVGLARALAADQPILLMDEPFGALDPITRTQVRKDFRSLDEVRKKTVILVTHDVAEAFELGDRICLMNEGRVAQWGTPADLLLHPASEFVRAFFDGERLFLELGVTTVEDIWRRLPEAPPNGASSSDVPSRPDRTLAASASLRQALEAALAASGGHIFLERNDLRKRATAADLLTAYQAHKNP
jgi:osmoprotectant transport system ATP-binding protein